MTATLAVIAKGPRPGRSKTRLCPPCTPDQAAALAEAALTDTLAAMAAAPVARRVVVLDGDPGAWLPRDFDVVPQRGGDLAERLANAFEDLGGPALIIGMDTPQVTPGLLSQAVAGLARAPSVIGPAADGGYWCIGLRAPDRAVFADVPMSTTTTGRAQLARLQALGLQPWQLPALRDVDEIADARAVAEAAPATGFARLLAAVEAA